jgi:hypothetical protein
MTVRNEVVTDEAERELLKDRLAKALVSGSTEECSKLFDLLWDLDELPTIKQQPGRWDYNEYRACCDVLRLAKKQALRENLAWRRAREKDSRAPAVQLRGIWQLNRENIEDRFYEAINGLCDASGYPRWKRRDSNNPSDWIG